MYESLSINDKKNVDFIFRLEQPLIERFIES